MTNPVYSYSPSFKSGSSIIKSTSQKTTSAKESAPLIWNKKVPDTNLEQFRKKVSGKYNISLDNYWDLHKWSIEHFENFWEEVWEFFDMKTSKPHDQVFRRTGDGFLDIEWFPGTLFNVAENMLKIRDNRTAIIYSDETGYEETITYAEMFEETQLYTAAFRKHGLQKGDRVACYLSNRKEAVYIYLATLSIGAIFGGAQPYYGARSVTNMVKRLEPKFLISVDHHTDDGIEFHNIDNLPEVVQYVPSLEKVIIIPTRQDTYSRDISHICNSCFLHEFLETGRESNGMVPDIAFEQLPFDHPIAINFTSGTTGIPKGPVHSAGAIMTELVSHAFYWNLKPGDVVCSCYPVGWTLFNNLVPCLSWGMTLFLYAGSPYFVRQGSNFWDILAQYKVTFTLMITSAVDKLEKMDRKPAPSSNLENLKCITIGGSPVKAQNCLYIKNKVKEDIFVTSQYGATESFGSFTGFDMNLPSYAGENQVPGLGVNLHCFNDKGQSILDQRGEMVLMSPTPALLTSIWKDHDNTILNQTYLSKYPGCWCQNDEIWINSRTKGIIAVGRSDDTLIQNGERFGAGDVYFAIHDIEEIQDYICVGQTRYDGETRAVLFIKMKEGHTFSPDFKKKVEQKIFDELWVDCVPQVILETKEVPYNVNNKKMESVVRKIIATNQIPEVNNIKNPHCLPHFCNIPELVNFMKH